MFPEPRSRCLVLDSGVYLVMENYPLQQRTVVVTLENGLHVRPMSQIAQLAREFSGEVSIKREDGYLVDAKNVFDLLTLRAEHGMELVLQAQGVSASEFLDELVDLFETNFPVKGKEQNFAEQKDLDSCPQTVEPD